MVIAGMTTDWRASEYGDEYNESMSRMWEHLRDMTLLENLI